MKLVVDVLSKGILINLKNGFRYLLIKINTHIK